MNENKPNNGERSTGKFANGKGFYLVLLLCIAVTGVAGYAVMRPTPPPNVPVVQPSPWTFPSPNPSPTQPAIAPQPTPTHQPAMPSPQQTPPVYAPQPSPTAAPTSPPVVNIDEEPYQDVMATDFFVRPVDAELPADFADNELTFNPTLGVWRFHGGLDIFAPVGTPVVAVADGQVEYITVDMFLGHKVVIAHPGGLTSVYANLDAAPDISIGETVTAGQTIGAVGTSAPSKQVQAAHLHFEMHQDGSHVNPLLYLP